MNSLSLRSARLILLGSSMLAATATAHAQTWDGSSSGSWNTAANWSTNAVPGANAAVTFYDTGAINLNTTTNARFTLNSITFNSTATSPVTINVTASPTAFNAGTGIRFNGNQTNISVAAGDHKIVGTGVSSGTSYDVIFNGAAGSTHTFDIASGASFEIQGRVMHGTSNDKTYAKTGTGTLILSGPNGGGSSWSISASKAFQVQEGVLRLAGSNAAGLSSNNFTVTSGAAIELATGFGQTLNNGVWTLNGTGIGSNGALRAISGSLSITTSGGTGGINLATNSSIGVDAGASLSIAPILYGTRALTKVGSGTLTLSGTNTYTGATTISSGTLRAGAASGGQAFGNGSAVALADVAGATLDLNNFDQTIGSLAGGGTTGGNVTLGSATLTTGGNNTSTAFSGVISGTGALAKTGSGTFTLSGDNSHSGGTSSSGTGMLALAHSNAAGNGTISLASTQTGFNTTFQLSGGINVANDIVMDSATGRNTITSSSGNNNLSGDITINNNSTNLIVFQNRAGNGTTFTLGGATPNSTTLAAADYANTISFRANTGDTTALGVINSQILAPNATFNINNDGVWTVNSTGNSWAATTLSTSSSRIILGADDALATGARIDTGIVGASVDLNGFNQTVAGLDGTNTGAQIFNDSATTDSILTLAGLAADRSFAGAITDGSGGRITSLVMNNSNAFVQTLSGTNTFTGTTTVTAGTLLVNGSLASGSAVTVETNGILGGNGTINGTLAIDGKVAPGGVGIDIKTLNAGATTWNDGGVLNFDLATTGTTSDKLNITGDFIKGSAGTYEFNFMGSTPAWGTTFTLVEWSGDLTGFDIDASDFSYTNLGAGSYSTSYFSIDGKKLQFTAIPEPTSAMAGLLLGFGLLRRRRA